jgi:antitoxin component YwqK of YwqJK toxin-antitoxin module/tetratricopeptide (TPR) repeat protein
MHLRHYGAALALLSLPSLSQAQTTTAPTLPDAKKLIKEGVELHDAEKYDEAVARYRLVTPGDSSYALAQAELALSLVAAKKYEDGLAAARRSLAGDAFQPTLYSTMGSAYEELKQADQAGKAYADGLKLFPYSYNLLLNKAATELNMNQLAAALATLQRCVELQPGRPSGHRLLGLAAARQGQTTHAMLSWLMYLAIEPSGGYSQSMLINLERMAQNVPVLEPKDMLTPVSPNAAFEELDQLITSKVALDAGYVSKVKFKAAIVKQLQLIVEKYPDAADPATDFWARAYGPAIKALRQGDNLTTFTYLILSSADDKSAQQWVKGNKSKLEKLANAIDEPLLSLRTEQPLPTGPGRAKAWYDDGALEALGAGDKDAQGKMQPTGDWLIIDKDGSVAQRGAFAAGKRTGKWLLLRPDGTTEAEQQYGADGKLDGLVRHYYPGGQLKSESPYRQGKLEGLNKQFAESGELSESQQLVNNDYEGDVIEYYPGGAVNTRIAMKADKRNGRLEGVYPDGTPEVSSSYADGKPQGEVLVYYPDKTLEKKANYDQGELNGPYATYFANGKPRETGQYAKGKRTGAWKEFYASGLPSLEETYDANGERHGVAVDYDEQGRRQATIGYEHGLIARMTSLDASGKVLADTPTKKGRVPVKTYDADGRLKATGEVENGYLAGEWKMYYPDGTLREIKHYGPKARLVGLSETYFNNGQLRQRRQFSAEGEGEGYFEQYFADGALSQTGFMHAGENQGVWKSYYPTGKLSQEREYFKGELSGPLRSYTPGGKLTEEKLYAFGKLREQTAYDSTGKVVDHYDQLPTRKELVLHYPGRPTQVMNRAAVRNGVFEGPSIWLFANGKPESELVLHGGKRYGHYLTHFANGQKSAEGQYLNGNRYGQFSSYYPSGQLSSQGSYRADEPVGEWKFYFPNGQLEKVVPYDEDGEVHGRFLLYNPAGELLLTRQYVAGTLVGYLAPSAAADAKPQPLAAAGGAVQVAFANGKPAASQTYRQGYPDANWVYYYSSGQVFRRMAHQKGLLSGPTVSYWPNGKLMEEESYLHDELHGRCRYYRPDGTLEREENYRAGERSGPSTTYDAQGKPLTTTYYWNNSEYAPK